MLCKKKLKEDKIRGYTLDCIQPYNKFYNKIDKELINLIPEEVQDVCSKE